MFIAHIALALELMALTFGIALVAFTMMNEKIRKRWIQVLGYTVVALALLSIICTIVTGIKFWSKGYHHHRYMMRMMNEKMMDKQNPQMDQRGQQMNQQQDSKYYMERRASRY